MSLKTAQEVQVARGEVPTEYTATLTSDALGAASATVTLPVSCWVKQIALRPDAGGTAPTAFTTFVVDEGRGADLLSGKGAGAVVNDTTIYGLDPPVWVTGNLTVSATGMGDSNGATVYVAVL